MGRCNKKKKNKLPLILVSCGSKGGNRGCVCCPGFFNRTPTTCGGGIIILASLPSCFLSLSISVVRHISLAHIPLSLAIVFTNRQAGFRWKPLRVFSVSAPKRKAETRSNSSCRWSSLTYWPTCSSRPRGKRRGLLSTDGFFLRVVSLSLVLVDCRNFFPFNSIEHDLASRMTRAPIRRRIKSNIRWNVQLEDSI